MLEPAAGAIGVAEEVVGDGDDACQAIEPIGFEARQLAIAPAALQAARGEIEGGGELFQGQSGGAHEFFDNSGRESVADGLAHFVIAGEGAAEGLLAAKFGDDCLKFVYHIVAYYSDKWRDGPPSHETLQLLPSRGTSNYN